MTATDQALLRALDDLIAGRWILTTENTENGGSVIVAHRPIGWKGPGNPHERLVAGDHHTMWALLTRRQREGA
ncbi:hypothetical protein KIK06_23750 [Nocardiopsis sp. EMB25]|uniref:hypothetical protein n=1 Tax=Nocardiopsis TaxID=2013 RepID=UPI000348324B|nr:MULTISPECIES: hypothetical protein [Nocardiopsis]MCY9786902.1 hypothetical protein [Nocardiopsis sp. EMB25]